MITTPLSAPLDPIPAHPDHTPVPAHNAPSGEKIEEKILAHHARKMARHASELDSRQAALRARWQLQRWEATVWRDTQLASVHRAYQTELQRIEANLLENRDSIKTEMINRRLEKLKKVDSQVIQPQPTEPVENSQPQPEGEGMKRSLRSKQKEKNAENGGNNERLTQNASRRRVPIQDITLQRLGVNTSLPENEASLDVTDITKAVSEHQSTRRPNTASSSTIKTRNSAPVIKGPSAVVENTADVQITDFGTLQYEGHEFVKGDNVTLEINNTQFTGTLSSIGSAEIWIRRSDGTKNKIYLGQLRVGKYKIVF